MMGILHVPLNAFNPSIACEYTSHPSLDSYFLFCYGCRSKNIARIANAVQVIAVTAGILITAGSMGGGL